MCCALRALAAVVAVAVSFAAVARAAASLAGVVRGALSAGGVSLLAGCRGALRDGTGVFATSFDGALISPSLPNDSRSPVSVTESIFVPSVQVLPVSSTMLSSPFSPRITDVPRGRWFRSLLLSESSTRTGMLS